MFIRVVMCLIGSSSYFVCCTGVGVERLYSKRPILCLASSKILTPHPSHRPASVYPPRLWCGGYTLAGDLMTCKQLLTLVVGNLTIRSLFSLYSGSRFCSSSKRICDTDPSRLYCEWPRPSMAPCWASKAHEFDFNADPYPDPAFHPNAYPDPLTLHCSLRHGSETCARRREKPRIFRYMYYLSMVWAKQDKIVPWVNLSKFGPPLRVWVFQSFALIVSWCWRKIVYWGHYPELRARCFKELLRKKLSLYWGWPMVRYCSYCSNYWTGENNRSSSLTSVSDGR
jgi:hypothetical protein